MFPVVEVILGLFLFYSLIKIVRRKLCVPNFAGKTVWITGASSGIGQYLAYEFSRSGASLIISARNLSQLQRVRQNCTNKDKVQIVKLDMTNFAAVNAETEKVIASLEAKGMKLDMIVQNAGVSMRSEFKNYDFLNHLSLFDINVNGPYYHIKCCVDHMIKNKSGHIVGITSVQGKLSPPFRTSYAGSKHAFIGILDSLRSELYDYNIKVTNIMPGYVSTNLSKNAFAANAGQKFGENQDKKGMTPQAFCKQAVKAIFMGERQAQISNQLDVPIGIFLRNLCPDLVFFGLRKTKKKPQPLNQKTA